MATLGAEITSDSATGIVGRVGSRSAIWLHGDRVRDDDIPFHLRGNVTGSSVGTEIVVVVEYDNPQAELPQLGPEPPAALPVRHGQPFPFWAIARSKPESAWRVLVHALQSHPMF